MTLPNDVRERLTKVLGMTGSSHEGEVLAALRKAQAIMATAKVSWRDVLEGGPVKMASPDTEAIRRAYREGYDSGRQVGRVEGQRMAEEAKPKPGPYESISPAGKTLEKLKALVEHPFGVKLTDWEREFVNDILKRRPWDLSEKQAAVVARILLKNGIKP